MKGSKTSQLLTIAACLICVGLVFTSADSMVIIFVIGILDFLLGVNIVRTNGPTAQAKLMLVTGAYIFVMVLLHFASILPEQWFWDIFAGGLAVVVIVWFFLLRKAKKS